MDNAPAAPSLYPLHRCKILHLVRHAQGIHNIEGAEKTSPQLRDAQLSPLGWEQVDDLRKHVHAFGLLNRIELVITSPMLRAMQTATGAFGGGNHTNGMNEVPLMVENVESGRTAISSLNCPPFIAHELCRERLGINTCDQRRSIKEYRDLFPAIDFSLIEDDDDILWTAHHVREANEELSARGMKFMKWLWTRKEKEIAIVTHSAFLFETMKAFGNDCHPSMKSEICKLYILETLLNFTSFTNCELRSVVLVNQGSSIASEAATTNYPGRIPFGLDLPSDLANEKQESNEHSTYTNA